MSKLLVKILSICAFVVLLPLIVVGSALCVTEAREVTLTIYQAGEERPATVAGTAVPTPTLSIYIDNEKQVDAEGNSLTSISVQKNTEVEVRLEGYNAYTFAGWYEGNIQDPSTAGDARFTGAEYTFTLRSNTALTAVRNIKTYAVEYAGKYDDGSAVEAETASVYYNQELKVLTPKMGASFMGWIITNSTSSDNQTTQYANWNRTTGSGESYILSPVWSDIMTVVYYDSDRTTQIATATVSRANLESYQLIGAENSNVQGALTPNYAFAGWTDSEGTVITDLSQVEFTQVFNLYLVEELNTMIINYYDGSELITSVSVDRDDIASYALLSGDDQQLSSYLTTGYRFAGWRGEDNNPVTDADLASRFTETLNLYLTEEISAMIVEYYQNTPSGPQLLTTQYLNNADELSAWAPIDKNNSAVSGLVGQGYSLSWTGIDEVPTTEFTPGVYQLYMLTQAVNYDVIVKFNALSEDSTTITYNVESGFSAYDRTRTHYTFVGFAYNGITYTYVETGNDYMNGTASLGSIVLNAEGNVELTAVWEAMYKDVTWIAGLEHDNGSAIYYYDGTDYQAVRNVSEYLIAADILGEGYMQYEQSIYDILLNLDLNNLYVNLDGSYQQVTLSRVAVAIDSALTPMDYVVDIDITFGDLISDIMAGDHFTDEQKASFDEITIIFYFATASV